MEGKSELKSNGISNANNPLKSLTFKELSPTNNFLAADDEEEIDEHSRQILELNNRIKTDFMSHCYSFLQDDEETRECVQIVWQKYLQCVGDVAMISTFFDTLPYSARSSALPKYQNEIIEWCRNLFNINCDTLHYSMNYSETFLRVIRNALKQTHPEYNPSLLQPIIYVSNDFDTNLKAELLFSVSNIKFELVPNDVTHEDMINLNKLEEFIQRDSKNPQSFPFMVIANAGTALLGHCDNLTKIKQLCEQHHLWLHVTGDLLGSLAVPASLKENVNINCDSLTMDIVKLLGIQNLPYLTFFIRAINKDPPIDLNASQDDRLNNDSLSTISTTSTNASLSSSSASSTATANNNNNENQLYNPPSVYETILQNPSAGFLSIWSVSQRCSKTNVLHHMKRSFDLSNLLAKRLKQMKTLRILNDENDSQEVGTYKRICSADAPDDFLPKTVVLFRFETNDVPEIETIDDLHGYIDLLNLWLFDKLSQQYPKMNLELLKSVHFQMVKPDDKDINQVSAHAIRFAPLEHLLDIVDEHDLQVFTDNIQRFSDILLATMTARAQLASSVSKFENLVPVSMPHWAGIGAIRYMPSHINLNERSEATSYDINTIQAELARKLQSNDTAFSLGGGTSEHDSMFYLRLGMIRKHDDLGVLLQKIADAGKETETALKYVEDMAEKIRLGIEKVQKDLRDENQQILAQEGLLRQLPVISNIMTWWSPPPTASPLSMKGRSFDLNSGRVESTEDTYVYRMQVDKQSPHAPTHNEHVTLIPSIDALAAKTNPADTIPEQKNDQ